MLDILTWESKNTASTKGGLGTKWFKCQKNWHQHSTTPLLGPKLKMLFSVALGGGTTKIHWRFAVAAYRFHPSWLSSLVKYPNFCYIRVSNDWFSKPTKNLAVDLLMESASSVDTAVLALCVGFVSRPTSSVCRIAYHASVTFLYFMCMYI